VSGLKPCAFHVRRQLSHSDGAGSASMASVTGVNRSRGLGREASDTGGV
jgi:hypothetical protein